MVGDLDRVARSLEVGARVSSREGVCLRGGEERVIGVGLRRSECPHPSPVGRCHLSPVGRCHPSTFGRRHLSPDEAEV
eukprot:1564939-Pyramimonas_sp.AAC.1